MNTLLLYVGIFNIVLSILNSLGELHYKDFPRKYYFRIISAVFYIIIIFLYMLILVPFILKLSLYELYNVPYDTTACILLVIWVILVVIYLFKIFLNIKKLHNGIF
jgi:hypothetical protein